MKVIAGVGAILLTCVAATACGGASKKENSLQKVPAAAESHSGTGAPVDENKVAYHDATAGEDVTVKKLRKIVAQMPKELTCKDLLAGGKIMGNTYPNGDDLYLRVCNEVSRG